MDIADSTLTHVAAEIAARRLSPVDVVDATLDRIATTQPRLNAFADVFADAARRDARVAEQEIATTGPRGPLHGIPIAIKDLIDVAGTPTGAGSDVRATHRADHDAEIVQRLRAAGTIVLGKAHTHEFAYGLTTPATRNAHNPARVAGGSSGGSAVAVASGGAFAALGTDTGGSIRVPSALNGVVGLKPTYDLLPRDGVTSLSWSLDHVGPITRTVADAELVLSALTGRDIAGRGERDDGDLAGVRVGVPTEYFGDRISPDVADAFAAGIDTLLARGAQRVDVAVPMARYIHAIHWGLMVPEASSYHEQQLRTDPSGYGDDVRVLLEAGLNVSAGDYLRAQRSRTLMRDAWTALFTGVDGVDVIITPTVPTTAVQSGQDSISWPDGCIEDVAQAYVRLCAPANVTGFPAVTIPAGIDTDNLPMGLSLMAKPFDDATALRVGRSLEHDLNSAVA